MKVSRLLTVALASISTVAIAAPGFVRISHVSTVGGKTQSPMNIIAAVGETSTMTIRGDASRPEVLLTLKPVLAADDTVTLETAVAVNRMLDTPAPNFDRREVQVTLRSKLGEPASIETAGGVTYQWIANTITDEEARAMRQAIVKK